MNWRLNCADHSAVPSKGIGRVISLGSLRGMDANKLKGERDRTIVRHEAEIDGLTYFDYIRHRNPDAALRFLAAID